MSDNLDVSVVREYVKAHVTTNGMEKVEDFLVQLLAKYPENLNFAKEYFQGLPQELGSVGLDSAACGAGGTAANLSLSLKENSNPMITGFHDNNAMKLNPCEMEHDAQLQPSGSSTEAKSEWNRESLNPTNFTKNKTVSVSGILIDYVKEFGQVPEDDLRMLRQITNDSYKRLNPGYWDVVGRLIRIWTVVRSGVAEFDIWKIEILDRDFEELNEFYPITSDIWASEIEPHVHTFRTMIVEREVDQGEEAKTDLTWTTVIPQISPYITTLRIDFMDFKCNPECTLLTAQQIREFIQRFGNQKKIEISLLNIPYDGTIDPAKLEIVLRSLNPSIQVEVEVWDLWNKNFVALINRCGDILNISWIVNICEFEGIIKVLPILRQRPNSSLTLEIDNLVVNGLDELRIIAEISLEFQHKINKIHINLSDGDYQDQDEAAVKNYLGILRPFVTDLSLTFGRKNWNIMDGDAEAAWSWPKLECLYLHVGDSRRIRGNIPIAIKNSSPNLRHLALYGPQHFWIFRVPEQSDVDSIKHFFSPLPQLESLQLRSLEGIIKKTNQLEGILKSMLPKLKEITYLD